MQNNSPGDTIDSQADDRPISSRYANYVLGVLFVVYIFNFVDRQVLSVFIGPIKEEFGASDTQMGLLVGFAFALLYTIAGIPIARWADKGNRRNIIALGLLVWSAMTVLSGFARSFVQLALARVGVGIGEAAGSPPAHSLIADYFPIDKRGTALAIYASGAFVGGALAFLAGGYLREFFDWRTAFIVVGAPGILMALIVRLTVREPPRGLSEQRTDHAASSTFMDTLRFLLRSRAWVIMMAGYSLLSLTGYAILMWAFEFLIRVHAMDSVSAGTLMGVVVGVGGCAGSLLGGWVVDRAGSTRVSRSVSVPALFTIAGIPLGVVFLTTDDVGVARWCFLGFFLMLNVYVPAMFSANQNLARLDMRATASALMLFCANIVGAGAGPLLVGALSDFFAQGYGAESIRYALLCCLGIGGVGSLLLLFCSRFLEADIERARAAD
ncbi:MAG: MFS transporter [Halioglobus sp.]|nr:MFS transporter [Halioglobus sp.]